MGGFQDRDKFHPDEVVLSVAEQRIIAEIAKDGQADSGESTDEG
ncbi:hypothetical protein ACIF6L_24710 [Kitasatospora sp. NPDC086009]